MGLRVINFEIKPLGMTFCIDVVLENEIVSFNLVRLGAFRMTIGVKQVSALEMRIEAD